MQDKTSATAEISNTAPTGWRGQLRAFVELSLFQNLVIGVICVNAVTLGFETLSVADQWRPMLMVLDRAIVVFFLIELILRLIAYGPGFFKSGWNNVDFLIIVGTTLAASNLFAALRAFRILRVLRVVSVIPRMRTVVQALVDSIPGIISVAMVALLIVYVFAVISSNLYGNTHDELFGDVFTSMYTLFQVITLEGWREIADEVSTDHPYAWVFFITFVLIGTFTMLNLFIAIVVRVVEEEADETDELVITETNLVLKQLEIINAKMDAMEKRLPPPASEEAKTSSSSDDASR